MGPRKRFHIVLQIVGFLIVSVGILFFCQYLSHMLNSAFETEGFQAAPGPQTTCMAPMTGNPNQCTFVYDTLLKRNMYYCPTELAALDVLKPSSMCLVNSNDNVCISTTTFGSAYYTCYRRPPKQVFDAEYGVWKPASSDPGFNDDTSPSDIAPNIDVLCATYAGNTVNVIKQLMSTIVVRNEIDKILQSTTVYKATITRFITLYCQTQNANTSNIPNLGTVCASFSNVQTFFTLLPDKSIVKDQSLNSISTVTNLAVISLSNLSTTISVSFNGFNCSNNIYSAYTVSNYIINS